MVVILINTHCFNGGKGIAGHLQCRISTKSLCWAVMEWNHVNVDLGGFFPCQGWSFQRHFLGGGFEAKKHMFTPHFEEVEPNFDLRIFF